MVTKKVPLRKCLGCGEMLPQKQLVRVVRTKAASDSDKEEYTVSIDLVGKKAGRGAYICKKAECFNLARKAKRFQRALNCEIPSEVFDQMEKEMKESE